MCYHHLHSRTYSLNSLHSIFFPPKFLTLATTEEEWVERPGEQFTDDTCDCVGDMLEQSCVAQAVKLVPTAKQNKTQEP